MESGYFHCRTCWRRQRRAAGTPYILQKTIGWYAEIFWQVAGSGQRRAGGYDAVLNHLRSISASLRVPAARPDGRWLGSTNA